MIGLILGLVVIGVLLYLVNLLPMDATIKQIVWVLGVLVAVLYVLQCFGIVAAVPMFRQF